MNVLMTSASRKLPLLRSIRHDLQGLDPQSRVTAADADPQCLASFAWPSFVTMPAIDHVSADRVCDWIVSQDADVVIPTRDRDVLFLSENQAALDAAGRHPLVSVPSAVRDCLDKLNFSERLTAAGIPTVPTFLELGDRRLAGDIVVKERFGAGSHGLVIGVDEPTAARSARDLDAPLFQPRVAGREISIDVFRSRAGVTLGMVARTRDLVVQGESQVSTVIDPTAYTTLTNAVLDELGLTGHALIQVIDGADGPVVLECNPRLGGASTLSLAAGLRSLAWFALESRGDDPAQLAFTPRIGLRLIRTPTDTIDDSRIRP